MDGTVRIWSLVNGTCLHTLTGHTSLVGLLGLSPSYLVSAAADSTLRIWDPSTGELKHTLAAHTGAITCFQHDEFKVLSGSDGNLKMWNVKDGTVVRDLLTGITGVWQVVFEGRWCVSASNRNDSTVLDVWDFGKECDGGWVGEPTSGVYDDESWSEYEEDEEDEGEDARHNVMGTENQGESGDTDTREHDGEEQDGMVVEVSMPVDLARLREKRNTMYDPRKGCPATTSAHTGLGSQSEMMEQDHNMYEEHQDMNTMELVLSDSEHSELEVAGRIIPDRPTHPLPHSYHHHHHHHHHHHSHTHPQPQTPSSSSTRHVRDKQCVVPRSDDPTIEYDRARPGPCASAPVSGASMVRRHRGDRHLTRLALDVFPGGDDDDYAYERPRFLRELEEQAEREESGGDVDDADDESDRNEDGPASMARWGSSGPTSTGVVVEGGGEEDGEVCCEPSTSTRSSGPATVAPLRRRGEGEREVLDLAVEPCKGSSGSSSSMGMRKQLQLQPSQEERLYEGIPVLPVSQDTPTRHRIVNYGQVKRRRN